MSRSRNLTPPAFVWRMTAIHIITYFIAGLFFFLLFDYKELFGVMVALVMFMSIAGYLRLSSI